MRAGPAIDGKTLRRSFDKSAGRTALHMVTAWVSDLHLSIGQLATEEKSNEITAVPQELASQWQDIRSIGMVYRHREMNDHSSDEVSFFLSSLPPKVRALARHVRDHWGVENGLHWSLDVTFSEDLSRIRKGNGQEIAGGLRRLALSILKQDTTIKESLRGKRRRAGWNNDTLQAILTGIPG